MLPSRTVVLRVRIYCLLVVARTPVVTASDGFDGHRMRGVENAAGALCMQAVLLSNGDGISSLVSIGYHVF